MVRILVADDDKHTRRLMQELLRRENFEVLCAGDGNEALSCLEKERIDLVILDIMMPGINGYELTEQLRRAGYDMPILMVSAKQLPADKRQGFLAGTDDYMTKPVDEEELVLRIRALLRRARIASEHKIEFGGIVLDDNGLSVSGHGQTLILPQKEFRLLYLLLSYPGKIFTRIQIMDEIWGMESDSGWETVTVHIARLRKRFENWPEFRIESVRGLGYRAVRTDG